MKMCQELFQIWEFFNCITFYSLTTWSLGIFLHLPPKSHGPKQDDNCSKFFCILEVNVNRNKFSGENKTIFYADLSPAELCSQTDGGGDQQAEGGI